MDQQRRAKGMNGFMETIGNYFAYFILAYMVIVISFYAVVMVISVFQLRKEYQLDRDQSFGDYMEDIYTRFKVSVLC
jgi:hypothetical protein